MAKKKKDKSKSQEVIDLIDSIIAPENMSQEEAMDFLGEIETFCQGMADAIQDDIDRANGE
jgi:hypothetical protein